MSCECVPTTVDKYSRMIARCRVGETDINAEMIHGGMAWATARQRQAGLWQVPNAMPPWEWRQNAWAEALRESPEGRPIKGNFKRSVAVSITRRGRGTP